MVSETPRRVFFCLNLSQNHWSLEHEVVYMVVHDERTSSGSEEVSLKRETTLSQARSVCSNSVRQLVESTHAHASHFLSVVLVCWLCGQLDAETYQSESGLPIMIARR